MVPQGASRARPLSRNFQHIYHEGWFGYRVTVFTHRAEVCLQALLDQAFRFVQRESQRYAAGQIGDVCAPAVRRFSIDNWIFHFFRPVCFRIDERVPAGTSILGWPGTVTLPGFVREDLEYVANLHSLSIDRLGIVANRSSRSVGPLNFRLRATQQKPRQNAI